MVYLRKQLVPEVVTSREVAEMDDGTQVSVAGLVIRRQRPLAKAVFVTLEDEYGHSPLIVWPTVYKRLRHALIEPFVVVRGTVSRRNGTMNIVVTQAEALEVLWRAPVAKNWA